MSRRGKTAAEAFRDLDAALVEFGHAFLEAWPGRVLVWFCDRLAALIEYIVVGNEETAGRRTRRRRRRHE